MKKFFLFTLFLVGTFLNVNAQPPNYDDLLILFASEEYEKVLSKGEKYTQKDKTKKDAMPYYFMAHALYNMSKDTKFTSEPEFKNAFKDAIKYGGKCVKKDKDSSVFEEKRQFFSDLKTDLVEIIVNELESSGHGRTKGWLFKLYKISPNDLGGLYLQTAIHLVQGERSEGNTLMKKANAKLDAVKSTADWKPEDFEMLRVGLVEAAEIFVKNRQPEKAKDIMNKGYKWLANDEVFKLKYDEIVN
jgi:hypothetical protein